jgi:beta-aspartyl-peptidase (threonine type)
MTSRTPAIIVHGGAGISDPERDSLAVAGCEWAAIAGHALLEAGGTALDAVEVAVRVLEEDPEFNAGYGSVLTRAGTIEVDAAIMDGSLRAGAVGAVPWLRNPITLARRVLEAGEHVLLVGDGALAFGREHGIVPDPPARMISPRARERYARRLAAVAGGSEEGGTPSTPGLGTANRGDIGSDRGDTVGACAIDRLGHVAAATSTGGLFWKHPGRVGDSPLIGAGTYADDEAGAASATGAGEHIMRVVMTKLAIDHLRTGSKSPDAARVAVEELARRTGSDGGIIVIGNDGQIGYAASSPRMPWAAVAGQTLTSGNASSPGA